MDFQTLGVLLYRTREKKHLSLLDVCSGICSQSTLSRVEQGSRELDSLTSEMLLGRIGREVTRFELILNAEDYYLNQLRIEINENIEEKNYIKAKEKINLYRQHMPAEGKVHEQFCCYMECRILIAQNEITEKLSALLLRAIRYTIPDYLLENCVSRRLYSPVEIELIRMHITYNDRKCECNEVELFLIMDFVTEFYSLKQQEKIEIPLLVDCVKYEIALEKYNAAVPELHITELDIGRTGTDANANYYQAKFYYEFFSRLIEEVKKGVNLTSVTLWGLTDDASWRRDSNPLLFNADLSKKPAFEAMVMAAKGEEFSMTPEKIAVEAKDMLVTFEPFKEDGKTKTVTPQDIGAVSRGSGHQSVITSPAPPPPSGRPPAGSAPG